MIAEDDRQARIWEANASCQLISSFKCEYGNENRNKNHTKFVTKVENIIKIHSKILDCKVCNKKSIKYKNTKKYSCVHKNGDAQKIWNYIKKIFVAIPRRNIKLQVTHNKKINNMW